MSTPLSLFLAYALRDRASGTITTNVNGGEATDMVLQLEGLFLGREEAVRRGFRFCGETMAIHFYEEEEQGTVLTGRSEDLEQAVCIVRTATVDFVGVAQYPTLTIEAVRAICGHLTSHDASTGK